MNVSDPILVLDPPKQRNRQTNKQTSKKTVLLWFILPLIRILLWAILKYILWQLSSAVDRELGLASGRPEFK